MKKVLKNIFKWLLLVVVSFVFVFILVFAVKNGGLVESIYYKVSTIDKPILYSIDSTELEEICKEYQQTADEAFKTEENSNEKILELSQLYEKYPVGTTLFLNQIGEQETISDLYIVSLIMGLSIGTVIFVLLFIIKVIKKRKLTKKGIEKKEENKIEE